MMKSVMSSVVVLLIIIMLSSLLATKTCSAQSKSPGTRIPQEVIMTVPQGGQQKKLPVPFPHLKHNTIDCTVCHHNAYETLLMSSCSKEGCHFDTNKRKGVESFYAAFHETSEKYDRSCLDCHTSRKIGPTSCKDCHKHK